MSDSVSDRWSPRLRSVLRLVAAFTFMAHGTQKLFGVPGGPLGPPSPVFSLFWTAGMLETFGGALLLVGLFTRPVAFVLAGEMAVAYFTQHAKAGFWPTVNRGELAVLYCFLWLYLAATGGGPWSVDAWWHSRSRADRGTG